MIGLLLKDLYMLRSYFLRQILLLVALYGLISVTIVKSFSFIGAMIIMSIFMMLISCFSFDENAKWDAYVLTLPLSPGRIVGARYLLFLGAMAIAYTVTVVVSCAADAFTFHEGPVGILASTTGVLAVYLLVVALLMPLFYKVGVEKARIAMMLCIAVPVLGIAFLGNFLEERDLTQALQWAASVPAAVWVALGVAVEALVFTGSYLLSLHFFRKKEY